MQLQALLPLVTHPDPNADAVAAHAVAVANLIRAEIHALAVNVDIPPVSSALSRFLINVPEMIRDAEAQSRGHGERLLALVERAAAPAGIVARKAMTSAPLALLAETAATQARYFDLALLGLEAGNLTSRSTAEAVIFGSGRPSVLLPELCDVGAMDHVAIAWDGSRVAARAVGDALPFLHRAERVSVLTVVDEKPLKEKDAGARLAEGLRSRALDAEAVAIRSEDCPIAATLQQRAIERGAGLLVMGGYGHSRVRDFVLGGATSGVLDNPLMPVLISH